MRKLRSDSTFCGLSAGQREQLLIWLFNEGVNYAAAVERLKKEFGVVASIASVGRFYRREAEDRRMVELALAGGSVADYRIAARKMLGMAMLRACTHHNESRGDGLNAVVALTKLMLKDQEQEMREQWLMVEQQRLGLKP